MPSTTNSDTSNSARSQERQKAVLLVVLGALFVSACVYLYRMPWESKELDVGFSEEARRNPYLAASEFLSRFDMEVSTEPGLALLDDLPATKDTLLIASSRRSLSERRVNNLTRWVQDGGALILLADDLYDEEREDKGDLLLSNFGISLYEEEPSETQTSLAVPETPEEGFKTNEVPEQEEELEPILEQQPETFADLLRAAQAPVDHCEGTMDSEGLTRITIDGERKELLADLSSQRHLYFDDDKDYAYAANTTGAQLVYVEHGQGQIYVLTSLSLWRNKNIGCLDHAHLLRTLTENTQALRLLFNTDIEPLHELIWNGRRIAVCLLLLWLALWVWRSAYRTARIEPEIPRERREVMEHIAGISRFLFQQKEINLLLSGLREDCLPRAQKNAKVSEWSTQLGIDEHKIQWALTANIGKNPKELTNAVEILQKIRSLILNGD